MKLINSFSFLLPIALCLAFLPALYAADPNILVNKTNQTDLITRACQQAEEKDFCVSSLKAQPASHDPDTDLGALAVIAIKIGQANGTVTLTEISKKLNDSASASMDPVTEQCLEDCAEHYESAVEQLDSALAALTLKKLHEAKLLVASAITDADSCEDGFKQGIRVSVISQRSGEFQKIGGVIMAVLKEVERENGVRNHSR